MKKTKDMWENLNVLNLLWGSVILWVPILFLILSILPKAKAKFIMRQIRKVIRECKDVRAP